MMASVSIKVDGLRELGNSMRKLNSEVSKKIARSMTNAAAQLVKKAAVSQIIANPSIDTESLKDSVIVKRETKTNLTSEHLVTVRRRKTGRKTKTKQKTAPHAHFVEFGTVNMPAEPFLRPAIDNNYQKAANAMRDAGVSGIALAAKRVGK